MRFQGAAKWKVAKKVKLNCPGWTWQILPWLHWWSLPPRLLLPLPTGAAARQSHWVSWGVVSRSTSPRVPGKTTGARDAVVSQCTWLAKVCLLMGCKAAGNLGQQHRISRNCIVTSSPRLEGNISDAQWPVVYASSICAHQPFHINMCFTDHFSHTCTCSAVGCVFCSMCDNAFSMHRTPLPRLAGERPIKTIVRLSCGVADVLWCALRMPKESIPFPYMPGDVQFSMNSSSLAAMSCVTVGRLVWSV